MYFTKVIAYEPQARKMSFALEEAINETIREEKGAEFVSFSITNSAKAILVFKKEEKPVVLKKGAEPAVKVKPLEKKESKPVVKKEEKPVGPAPVKAEVKPAEAK